MPVKAFVKRDERERDSRANALSNRMFGYNTGLVVLN